MKRLALVAGAASALVALTAAAALGWVLLGPGGGQAYPAMEQQRDEVVPGTLELHLQPPPAGFTTSVDPEEAFSRAFVAPPRGATTRTLAILHDGLNPGVGGTAGRPAWIFFVRGVCYPQDKGDTVSPARSGMDGPCGPEDLAVTTVDATGGDAVLSFTSVDFSEEWVPANDAPFVLDESQAAEAKRSTG